MVQPNIISFSFLSDLLIHSHSPHLCFCFLFIPFHLFSIFPPFTFFFSFITKGLTKNIPSTDLLKSKISSTVSSQIPYKLKKSLRKVNVPLKLFPTVQILLSSFIACQIISKSYANSPEFFLSEANILRLENWRTYPARHNIQPITWHISTLVNVASNSAKYSSIQYPYILKIIFNNINIHVLMCCIDLHKQQCMKEKY